MMDVQKNIKHVDRIAGSIKFWVMYGLFFHTEKKNMNSV
jgi:hypothetical protein